MCTSPVRILNNSRFLQPNSGQKLYVYVPCGHCIACRRQQQNEWRVRAYYHCLDTIKNHNGYVLFDTLTYSSKYLPHVCDFIDAPKNSLDFQGSLDFPCFSADDVQKFKKRVGIHLKRAGYPPAKRLSWFIVSEYGTDQRYTHRPHYHLFAFVRDSFVPPLVLSRCISKAWSVYNSFTKEYEPIGRTDGVPFRHTSYVLNHNLFRTMDISTKKVVQYVAKYVSKDFVYSDFVRGRLFAIMDYYFPGFDWSMSKSMRSFYNMVKRFVLPFHRQSTNFGSYFYLCNPNLAVDGRYTFNFNGTPVSLSLSPNMKRKLFYDYSRDYTGVTWKLNYKGKLYRLRHSSDCVDSLNLRIANYNCNHDVPLKINAFDFVYNHDVLSDCFIGPDGVIHRIKNSFCIDSTNSFRNYASIDYAFIRRPLLSRLYYGNKGFRYFYTNSPVPLHSENNCLLSDLCILSQPGYDSEYSKLLAYEYDIGIKKLSTQKLLEKHKNKFKHFKLI